MMYGEAMEHVAAGRAVYSATLGGTVLRMPRSGDEMVVWQVTNKRPIMPMRQLCDTPLAKTADDWKLSGAVIPPRAAA